MLRVRQISGFVLYSSIWVSACAGALVIYTYDITGYGQFPDLYTGFVMCATLTLYAMHHLMGISRVKQYGYLDRFAAVSSHWKHIVIFGLAGVTGTLIFLVRLPVSAYLWLALPLIVSFFYVVPVGGRRWRDISVVKIFLIAVVWASLTGMIPYFIAGGSDTAGGIFILCERSAFIFAITVPFDIRDIHVDRISGLRTLPHVLGVRKARMLAVGIYLLSAVLCAILIIRGTYPLNLAIPYAASWIIAVLLILGSKPEMDDHYYSGLVDGTMFLLPFFYWLWCML
jgi:4-hydroxybenzoate polyprenyltransferase